MSTKEYIYLVVIVMILAAIVHQVINRKERKKREEHARRFKERLLNPDFLAIEKHFGSPLPQALMALYRNPAELNCGDFELERPEDEGGEDEFFIGFYEPADEESLKVFWPGTECYFTFANDGAGNGYMIDPRLPDPPVLFHSHESGEFEQVSDHVSKFLKWKKAEYIDEDEDEES